MLTDGRLGLFCGTFSYAKSVAADNWVALMDQLLMLGEDCKEERNRVRAKILRLINMYYDALDAPKKGGKEVSSVNDTLSLHEIVILFMFIIVFLGSSERFGIIYCTDNR